MKRSFAMLMALLLVFQLIPSDVFADPAVTVQEAQSVVTVSFGGEEYLFANGRAMETLPEAEERSRQVFDGWYFGDTRIEAPFTPEADMQLEARYVHSGTLITETEYAELWYAGDADVPSLTPADVYLPEKGEEPLEANIFTPAPATDIDIEFKVSAHLYALDSRGAVCEDLGWAEAGTGTTISLEKFPGYCLALEAPEKDEKEQLVLSDGSSADTVLRVEKMDLQIELTTSEGKKVTEYDTLFAASVTVADGKGNPVRNSSTLSYTDGAVLAAAVEGRRIVVMKNGEEIPCEVDKDTLTFTMNGQGQVGIYAFDDIVSWTWGQDSAPGRKSAKSTSSKASDYRMSMSGMMPYGTSASVKTVEAEIPGEEVLFAAEVTLKNVYGYDAVPRNGAIRVTVSGAGIGEAEDLHVFRVEGKETREITDVKVEGDRVTFGADAAGTYAVTQTIEQTVSIGGATYKITVAYGSDAMIPGGAELDVKEVSGDSYITDTAAALKLGEGDEIFYTKFLDIAIMADGKEIEPQAPVQVIVELLDVEAGAEALEVVHFGDKGAEKVEAQADAEGRVTFTADSFSVYGFGSILKSLLSWTGDAVSYTLQGFSALLAPTYTAIGVQLEEGLEALGAYRVESLLGSILNLLYVKVSAPVDLGERESVAVYSVKDGEIGELLSEGTDSGSIALSNAEGFAVVKDTGYRNLSFDLGDVTLSGMLPKAAEAEAEGADADALEGLDGEILAAWDISIHENGAEYQPDEEHPVDVSIALGGDADSENLHVWHILDDGTAEEIEDFTVADGTVSFIAYGFSVYVVTEAPEYESFDDTATMVADLTSGRAAGGFYLSVKSSTNAENYFTATVNGNGALVESPTDKEVWYFEPVEGTYDRFKIYTMVGDAKLYIKQKSNDSKEILLLSDSGTDFIVSKDSKSSRFLIKHATEAKWLQHSGTGNGIRFWTDANNVANSRILFSFVAPAPSDADPYGLNGKSYGIMNRKSEISAYGMMSEEASSGKLLAKEMLIRTDPMNQSNTLYVAKDSDITMWTFESIEEDLYYLKTGNKYLQIANNQATLVDVPDDSCVIRVIPGTGENTGKLRLLSTETGKALTLAGNNQYFAGGNNAASAAEWHNLVEYSIYTEEDFVQYTAQKVSVSDGVNVANGRQVVIYTRVWNEAEKKYEFYAVDHNGELRPCYESGDSIQWIGTQINTMLWDYTEYYVPGTTTQNGYYELRNTYSGKYIAPQINGGQIFADSPVGINLNGRYYGDYYTTVLAWDDSHYDYAGYRVENGRIVSCPMAQADTFYFAVMDMTEHTLTPVETVDHVSHGITMKMVNCTSREDMYSVIGNNDGGMGQTLHQGLLSTELVGGPNGYPKTIANKSLSELYAGEGTVNHLFIKSIYEGSGYYQYDSSENFAQLNGGEFIVYRELGTVNNTGNYNTRKHGQFMPYNTLTGNVRQDNPYNMTDIYGNELSNDHPRKYEPLYTFEQKEDYHFAMELTGSFVQPPNGHDAWGHDIIFDFVGDDDFWLYVDGELVIDLGGIHSAVPGSVNYSTGDVYVNGTSTTLRDLFYNNYIVRGHTADEAQAYVDEIFHEKIVNGETRYVFKDYSSHTIRIFYMERGGGASNLRMRFNLSTVTPGQVLLSKEITGTTKQDFASMRFPYQIYYQVEEGGEDRLLERGDFGQWQVVYQNTSTPVDYSESVEIDGVTYENVFYLKPGQTAAIKMPENTISYFIRECGVDTSIYDSVAINGEPSEGETPQGASDTKTYTTTKATALERARVSYSNHVNPSQLRTLHIRKRLFDAEGNELTAAQDPTGFTLRLRFGEELSYYNLGEYYVKDPNGNYCYYDPQAQMFRSIGVTDFDHLTAEQLPRVTFRTSPSGAASKLPAGYSIEVRELLVGTKFLITEEDYEIPVGYGKRTWTEDDTTYHGYKRVVGSYIVETGEPPNEGVIRDNSNPVLEIHNQRGWGIQARKIWSDADFILRHDDIYFAVYVHDILLPGTVRRIDAYNSTRYFFPALESGVEFKDYHIFEVRLTNPVVQEDGTVSSYDSITRLLPVDTLTIGGIQTDGSTAQDLRYSPTYTEGTPTPLTGSEGEIRTDTVTNTRVGGLRIIKTDAEDMALAGASFELRKDDETEGTYTSDESGLVTTAYLNDGEYTLTEIAAPHGYLAIQTPVTITFMNGEYSISEAEGVTYSPESTTIEIKNESFTLAFKKTDEKDGTPLAGAHFALYRQVVATGGEPRKNYYPMEGYKDLVSGEDGIITGINESLPAGTYYLTETRAPEGYELETPVDEVLFTISETGMITVQQGEGFIGSVTCEGTAYTILVPNGKAPNANLKISKVVSGGFGDPTQQFTFTLYRVEGEISGASYTFVKTAANSETPGTLSTGGTFMLAHGENIVLTVPKNKEITIKEDGQNYTTSWKNGDAPVVSSQTGGISTVTVTLEGDTELTVENHRDPVAPTAYKTIITPYLLLLSAGSALFLLGRRRKRSGAKR